MAQWQRGGDYGDGRRNGDGNGLCDGKVVAMTVMDSVTVLRHDSNRRRYGNATAMTSMDGRESNGDGRNDGNGNGRRNGDGDREATKSMDGATALASAMDGAAVTRWLQKAQWQRGGGNVDGLHGGNGDGRRNGNGDGRRDNKVVAMTVLDGATATAIARRQRRWMAQQT